MHPLRYTDADGQVLNGANKYVVKTATEPPVGAFWSLTIYNAADKMLVENPIQRYKVGTDTVGLKKGADGSMTIVVQGEAPEQAANVTGCQLQKETSTSSCVFISQATQSAMILSVTADDAGEMNFHISYIGP
jgi:Protein of unknown function (DUF1214)